MERSDDDARPPLAERVPGGQGQGATARGSGTSWLTAVPAHWRVVQVKHLARIASGIAPPDSFSRAAGKYPVYGANGVIGFCDRCMLAEETLVVGRVGSSGLVNLAAPPCWVSDNALVLRELAPGALLAWLRYVLLAMDLGTQAARNAQPVIAGSYLGSQSVGLPPLPEQRTIAAFLDRKTAQIDALIAKKERLIELLEEKRTALITQAMTKGLDPNVPMKDSEVEWLGRIPAHWGVLPLKRVAAIRYGLGEPPQLLADGLPFVRATNVARGRISENDLQFVDPDDVPWNRNPRLRTGDIIVVRSGAYTGDSAIVPEQYDGAIAGYDMVATVVRGEARFIAWALLSAYVLGAQIELKRMRAAQPHLNAEELGVVTVVLPPDAEQRAIADLLDAETARIDDLTAKIRDAVELLHEYRTALISAAVTGRIDVRSEAA